jgi:microcin C transport system substrate-binding protein
MRQFCSSALVAALAVSLTACGGSSQAPEVEAPPAATAASQAPVSMNKNDYPVFPDPDAGADPSVPADEGGKGFTGAGWQTNTDFDLIGDPHAVKGGSFTQYYPDFPGTLRMFGPESNSQLNYIIQPMVYESLLSIHPTTLEYIPALATHWQISPDHMTYRFRIDPNARWSDGQPVTADDVVATWQFLMDKGLEDPTEELTFGKFEKPVAESKYIVRVHSKVLNWRNFMYFSGMPILPAHVLKTVDGATYLKDYNFKLLPGTGPYTMTAADIDKGNSVTIERRKSGYWAEKYRRNVGTGNFDQVRFIVIRDQNLAFERFKKGDLDFYYANISRQWVEDMNFDKVQRGLIQKRKVFNDAPQGVYGLAFNSRRSPWSDVRVREAFAHLMNRDLMIQKLFYNEYLPENSYYPGSIYENPNDPKMDYDPQAALKLLADAGWKSRDADGRLVKNGEPLTMEVLYQDKGLETYLTVYQDDLRRVGITMNLRLVTPETQFKLVMDRQFDVTVMSWGALLFPNPETQFKSTLADQKNNNNITGFKDPHVDELLDQYDKEFDQSKRAAIIQQIDLILTNAHMYALQWYAPYQRFAYWNRFGYPEGYLSRLGDYTDAVGLWWIDPQKQAALDRALRDDSVKLPVGQTEVRYWQDYDKRERATGQ